MGLVASSTVSLAYIHMNSYKKSAVGVFPQVPINQWANDTISMVEIMRESKNKEKFLSFSPLLPKLIET